VAQQLTLLEGEKVVFQLEGDVFGGGSNPLTQAWARVQAFILKILGTRVKAKLVVTDQRVIEYRETVTCWCIPTAVDLKVLLPHSVKEVGYVRNTSSGCCSFFSLYYESFTQRTVFPMQNVSVEQMNTYVADFYKAIKA